MISVVIPAYNSVKSIRRAIDSVLAQTYKDYEIIVIDDGSTDGTGELVKEYGDTIDYFYQENAGVCVARNAGIKKAKGEWIALLDHDDEWAPEKLARQIEIVNNNPDLRWCSTNYNQNDGNRCSPVISPEQISQALGGKDYFESYFKAAGKHIIRIMPTTTMIAAEVLREIGPFDPTLRRSEDTDLWCRIALRYPKIGFIVEPIATRYLDVSVPKDVIKLRIKQGTGGPMREVLSRYFEPAKELGCLEYYNLFARMELEKILMMCVYRGHKQDALETITRFRRLFSWHWRLGVRLLTLFPAVATRLLHLVAYMAYILRLDKQASRRWLYPKNSSGKTKNESPPP